MKFLQLLLSILISLGSAWAANNPDISVSIGLGGPDVVLVGKTTAINATLIWPPGDYTKPTGKYVWTVSNGLQIISGQDSSSITVMGVSPPALATVSVQWVESGYDQPSSEQRIKVIGIGSSINGGISEFTGDMYKSGGSLFIPPGGRGHLKAYATDKDDVAGEFISDEFELYDAFTWSAQHGTTTRDGQDSCNYVAPNDPVVDLIQLQVKDDGVYFPDREKPMHQGNELVYIYQLTGLKISGIAAEQEFSGKNFVDIELEEKAPGTRPAIKYEALDEAGEVVLSESRISRTHKFALPKPGRYTFRVTNELRPTETFQKSSYVFYTLRFSEANKSFNWENDELLTGMDKVVKKREELEEEIDQYRFIAAAANGKAYNDAYSELESKLAAYESTSTANLNVLNNKLIGKQLQLDFAAGALKEEKNLLDVAYDLLAKAVMGGAEQSEIDKLAALVAEHVVGVAYGEKEVERLTAEVTEISTGIVREKSMGSAAKEMASLLHSEKSSVTKLGSIYGKLSSLADKWHVGDIFTVLGLGVNVYTVSQVGDNIDKMIESWGRAEELQKEYKSLVDALRAGRKSGPLTEVFSVISEPANISFSFKGAVNWRTYDATFLDCKWPHLASLNDSVTNWDLPQSTDSTGSVQFTIKAYGNIGSENIYLDKSSESLTLSAGSLTEDDALNLIDPLIKNEQAKATAINGLVDAVFAIVDTALTALLVFSAFTLIGAVVAAGIQLALVGIQTLANALVRWIFESDLAKDVRKLFP